MRRVASILFWSVISAAFIGPGTVTTAASAGAQHGLALLWALAFSTLACLLLQEASARLTVVSGRDLGQALRERFSRGVPGVVVPLSVLVAVVLGCAAYEAGNLLGGVAGAVLATGWPRTALTLGAGGAAFLLLWLGTPRSVPQVLGGVVAFMGVAFLVTAVQLQPDPVSLARGVALPTLPPGSPLLVLGLVGTTVVPYNLFLGSGIARGQTLGELRFGLTVAVVLGGLISMAVLVVGTAVEPPLAFDALGRALSDRLGGWAPSLFAYGLLAAGLSSAITAPLAAAVAARSLLPPGSESGAAGSWRYRSVWLLVLLTGMGFGLADVQPIPAIILAQALNGILLPFVAVFLLLLVNDVHLMGREQLNGSLSNVLMILVVGVTVVLGSLSVSKALARVAGLAPPTESRILLGSGLLVLLLAWPVGRSLRSRRRGG